MLRDDSFDADEILRDMDEQYPDEVAVDDDMRELEFGTLHDDDQNFRDMVSDLDTTEDLWE
ncbi:MAG: hypothetical protein GF398_01295 [Chitinivibrionales bacterium]|nr:hypothetical protein [Chitinivibrionales bacterium]